MKNKEIIVLAQDMSDMYASYMKQEKIAIEKDVFMWTLFYGDIPEGFEPFDFKHKNVLPPLAIGKEYSEERVRTIITTYSKMFDGAAGYTVIENKEDWDKWIK